jgi:hypothetical protein
MLSFSISAAPRMRCNRTGGCVDRGRVEAPAWPLQKCTAGPGARTAVSHAVQYAVAVAASCAWIPERSRGWWQCTASFVGGS